MKAPEGFHDLREELLERTWNLVEEGPARLPRLLELSEEDAVRAELGRLTDEGLVRLHGDDVALTAKGRRIARHVVRAHRLAARLLVDLLELPAGLVESQACQLEHAISTEVADSLCTVLGHPQTAPDGRPIPEGTCCRTLRSEVSPAVVPLTDLRVGAAGRITFIHPRFAERLGQLSALGLVPGTDVRLRQRRPSIVVEIDQTTLAVDADVARDLFVKEVESFEEGSSAP